MSQPRVTVNCLTGRLNEYLAPARALIRLLLVWVGSGGGVLPVCHKLRVCADTQLLFAPAVSGCGNDAENVQRVMALCPILSTDSLSTALPIFVTV